MSKETREQSLLLLQKAHRTGELKIAFDSNQPPPKLIKKTLQDDRRYFIYHDKSKTYSAMMRELTITIEAKNVYIRKNVNMSSFLHQQCEKHHLQPVHTLDDFFKP